MRNKVWQGHNPAFHPPSIRQTIDEIIAQERRENNIMFKNVKIRMTHLDSGVNCEFDLGEGTNIENVKAVIAGLVANNFIKTTSSAGAAVKPDVTGKTGSIVAIEKVADKKMWKVTVTLHETGAGQVNFNSFTENWRKGDRVRLTKNDKGFVDAVLINDENLEGEKATSIPF